jgi:hypothetical protein
MYLQKLLSTLHSAHTYYLLLFPRASRVPGGTPVREGGREDLLGAPVLQAAGDLPRAHQVSTYFKDLHQF